RCPELTLCSNAQYKTTRTAQGIELTEDSKTRLMERLEDKPNFSLQGIRYLSCLQILDLSDTRISDTSDLVNLNNLRWLDLEGTQISDVSYFKNMTYLEELNLKGTKVYDPSPLLTLASLRKLDLRDTLISEGNCIDLKDTLTNTQVYCEGPCEEGYMFSEETCKCIPDPDGCKNLGKEECAQNMGCYSFSRSGRCGCPNCELLLSHVCLPK
ncbi:MAG: hypothetical protein JXB14_04795, partial [Candidatus Altiarchaeota archaeon]|nr:hypothetical protein [Candidatus Altiarchaeota archaeon]